MINSSLTYKRTFLRKQLLIKPRGEQGLPEIPEAGPGNCLHKLDETIRGHVFCSFLALVVRKELDRRLEKAGHCFGWADIKKDLKARQEITIEDRGKTLAIRSVCLGTCGKIFPAAGVAIPPTIPEAA